MRLRAFSIVVVSLFTGCLLHACGDDSSDVTCDDASVRVGSRCVNEDSGTSTPNAGNGGSKPPPTGGSLSCGAGTVMRDGQCVPSDAGTTQPPPPPSPVGSGCETSDDCAEGTTCLIDAKLPGGLCTVQGCDMTHPCPTGAYCNRVTKGFNICMPYCQDDSSCRKDDGYVCQPLYTNGINICAPSCTVTKACPSGTNCNDKNGLCEIAECDPDAASPGCKDSQTCWPDSQDLSSKGGLCLVLCDPNNPKGACKVDEKDEVCQPLAADPANTGFCAPPVCSKTEECPAGAICQNSVCQPPALCDSNGACSDDNTTCVSGVCMPKCPTGNGEACSDIHPGLTCASVLDVPACLPVGSFPGSQCRANRDDACSALKVGDGSAPMVCEDDTCLVDCSDGGQSLCSAIDADLLCASGIFDKPMCLPKGAFPGGPCGSNDSCAQDLQGNSAVDMKCVSGTCVIDCDESAQFAGYGDALCQIVDPSLTCANAAGSICVRACNAGACDAGFTCLDQGAVGAHENACLPTGSFPGSPCANGACANLPGGLTQSCVNGTCVVDCGAGADAAADDAICAAVDPSLTCSESAGDICVRKCNGSSCADAGFSCLNPGTEGACLPTGAFPGSPCRSGTDKCDAYLNGDTDHPMTCLNDQCVVTCNTPGDAAQDDASCAEVSSVLTCSESAGNICVLKCNGSNCALPGFSCLDPGGQAACLPTGSFPSSPCLPGDTCLDLPGGATQSCVQGQCLVDCEGVTDTETCQGVSAALVCSAAADDHCVIGCAPDGKCPSQFSCLAAGDENACLPNGTFPGSTCRASGTACDSLDGGPLGEVAMLCTDGDVCAPGCDVQVDPDGFCDLLGQGLGSDDPLTCLEIDGVDPICVPSCDGVECPDGFSCLGDEAACLPDGSFPGSACDSAGMCGTLAGGERMDCVDDTACLVACDTGDEGDNDDLCANVDARLTCSESAGHHCFLACDAGDCDEGFSCLDEDGENVCLPTGSFPGSPCAENDTCGTLPGGIAMVCNPQSELCVVPCDTGNGELANDALCKAVDPSLTCSESAEHICVRECNGQGACDDAGFSCLNPLTEKACLPDGSFPGSSCRAEQGNECDQDLNGNTSVDMKCASGTCAVDCNTAGTNAQDDGFCGVVGTSLGAALTCSESADNICVLSCDGQGKCPTGYSCLNPGAENACLPDGSFPGSACRAEQGNECDQDLKGNTSVDMKCASGKCAVDCNTAGNNTQDDGFCGVVGASLGATLTCSESAGNVCVLPCDGQGACPTGYSCLNPGAENACLPNGTFPGSSCRAEQGNECDQDLKGNTSVDMKCASGKCAIDCNTAGNDAQDDGFCGVVGTSLGAALTCSESAGNICVSPCNSGSCGTGFSCLNPATENACLPNGTFPGSACASGSTCFDVPSGQGTTTQTCVGDICVPECTGNVEQTCSDISPLLTCSAAAGELCVPKCNSGTCDTDFSCLLAGQEDECLPTGSFPSSPCRSTVGDECDQDLKGIEDADMVCDTIPFTTTEACLLPCTDNDDELCGSVDTSLTCFSTISLCVLKCGEQGECPPGYACSGNTFPSDPDLCLPD